MILQFALQAKMWTVFCFVYASVLSIDFNVTFIPKAFGTKIKQGNLFDLLYVLK